MASGEHIGTASAADVTNELTDDDTPIAEGATVALGAIVGVYGIKGWVRVQSYTRPITNLKQYRRWKLVFAQRPQASYEAEVLSIRPQGPGLVAELSGRDGLAISDRDIAGALVGAEIQVDRAELPKLPNGKYYWTDLIGLDVLSTSGAALGKVTGIIENGVQDVLQVEDGETERLIPFVRQAIVHKVEMSRRRILVNWEPDY